MAETTKIILRGDKGQARKLYQFGSILLDTLKNSMKFNDLKQGRIERILFDGSVVSCTSVFGLSTIDLFSPLLVVPKKKVVIAVTKEVPLIYYLIRYIDKNGIEHIRVFGKDRKRILGDFVYSTVGDLFGLYAGGIDWKIGDLIFFANTANCYYDPKTAKLYYSESHSGTPEIVGNSIEIDDGVNVYTITAVYHESAKEYTFTETSVPSDTGDKGAGHPDPPPWINQIPEDTWSGDTAYYSGSTYVTGSAETTGYYGGLEWSGSSGPNESSITIMLHSQGPEGKYGMDIAEFWSSNVYSDGRSIHGHGTVVPETIGSYMPSFNTTWSSSPVSSFAPAIQEIYEEGYGGEPCDPEDPKNTVWNKKSEWKSFTGEDEDNMLWGTKRVCGGEEEEVIEWNGEDITIEDLKDKFALPEDITELVTLSYIPGLEKSPAIAALISVINT